MDWDKLRIFHAVAEAGSLTHAGDSLFLSQSAISRQISALELSLNTVLFHRHARGLILTEQGELLLRATKYISSYVDSAVARIRDTEEEVFGSLRVTTTSAFGTLWLIPRIKAFYEKYPNLEINLILEERVLDLPMREADVAIRMKEPSQADLIRRKLLNVQMKLFASREYLKRSGEPKSLEDLKSHRLITQNVTSHQVATGLDLTKSLLDSGVMSHCSVNNYFGVVQAVRSDLGIGVLPDYLKFEFPELQQVLKEQESDSVPVYLAYPEELRHSKRVMSFRDFVVEEVKGYLAKKRREMGGGG